MAGRKPPPTYEETLGRRTTDDSAQAYASTGGHANGVTADHRSNRRRSAGASDADALEMAKILRSRGVKVVLFPPQRGKPEERTVWADATELVLLTKMKTSVRTMTVPRRRKEKHLLSELRTVTLGVPASEIWSSKNGQIPTPRGVGPHTERLSDYVPDPRMTLRLRFARDTVDMACYTAEGTQALYAVLSLHATAGVSTGDDVAATGRLSSNARSTAVGGAAPRTSVGGVAGGGATPRTGVSDGGATGNAVVAVRKGDFNSYDPGARSDDMDESFQPPPEGVNAKPNGGVKKQRSNLRDMMQQGEEFDIAREAFLADDDLDDGVDAAAVALKPHTLAEVSGAVPQTPTCYVLREKETSRLTEALVPEKDSLTIGGATTVLYDSMANGKSVLAAAAMQDPRVQGGFPGGVFWLRAGRAADGRLLRMMELTICQVAEETERTRRGTLSRMPERFNDVGAASDFLASLLVRVSPMGGLRETLLVLDDVWEASVVEAFETIGMSLLVTTREPLIARLATPAPSGRKRLIGPLGPLTAEEATAAAAKAAATRRAPPKEAKLLLDRTGRCPLAVGVVGSTLKQAQSPLDWTSTTSKVKRTYGGLQRRRKVKNPSPEEASEDRITASVAAGLSNMPEENQMLYSALCILPPGLPVCCRLLEQVWETGKRTTILAAEAFEHRRLLDRLGPGYFVLHYEAARFLQTPPGFAGDGAWVGCKLRGQGRELAFNRLCKHLDSFDTLRHHLSKRDLWGLTELWQTCEAEAKKTSGHSHVSCRIYESRLDLLRQESDIVAGPGSRTRASTAKLACDATLDLAQALDMVADYQAYGECCDAAPLYRESIEALRQSLDLVSVQGTAARALESRVKRALERITGKLGALLLKQGKPREALHPCAESLSYIRARQGAEGPDGGAGLGNSKGQPNQDVVDTLYSMAEALMTGDRVDEAEGIYEEAAIILRRLYGEEASLSLEARGTERFAEMMASSGNLDQAEALNEQCMSEATRAFGDVHPVVARAMDQKGQFLLARRDLDGAAAWFAEARKIREEFYGKGHALVAPSLEKQALLELMSGHESEAGLLLKQCLAIQEERYGPNDVRVTETCEKLKNTLAEPADKRDRTTRALDNHTPELTSNGEMEHDERALLRAIEVAEKQANEDGGQDAAQCRGKLARLLRDMGPNRTEDAEEAYRLWMERLQTAVTGQLPPGSDQDLAECINEYIDVLEAQGKDLDALVWELLNVDRRLYGKDSPQLATDMERFGRYFVTQQSYGEAGLLLRKALAIKEKNRGKDHPELAGILRSIGRVLFEVNGLGEACDAFDRALSIDQLQASPAEDVFEDMRSLGMVYCRQGLYDKAEAMYRKVVDMARLLKKGEEDPSVITQMNVLAVLLYAQGKMDQAEPLLKKVWDLREKALGADHVDVAESLVNLAVLNNKKGNYATALPMLNRALEILQGAYGSLHPETVACLSWIAETHQKQGPYSEAEDILVEVVSLNRQILGDDHPGVADSLSDLAEVCRAQGKLDEAEASHLEALQIREAYYGPEHETVAQSLQLLSLILQSEGREDEAQEYGRRVVAIRERVHEAGGTINRRSNMRSGNGAGAAVTPSEHGENARRNHARVAVEKSITGPQFR